MTVNMEEALCDGYYKFMVLDVIRHGKLCEMLSQRIKGEVMTAMCRLWKISTLSYPCHHAMYRQVAVFLGK